MGDDIPSVVYVGILGIFSANAEANDKLTANGSRHHVEFSGSVDVGQQLLVESVGALDAETHQSHSNNVTNFKTLISFDKCFETLGQAAVFSNVVLQSVYTVITDDEPEFKSAEAATQRYTPMPVIDGFARVSVLQENWIDSHGLSQLEVIANPHSGTVKVSEKPLVGVRIERHGVFDTLQQVFELWADECIASVSCINVEPCSSFVSNRTYREKKGMKTGGDYKI